MLVVGAVGSNLVHRKRIVRHGAGVRAERVDETSELVASRDTWFRPVQFAMRRMAASGSSTCSAK